MKTISNPITSRASNLVHRYHAWLAGGLILLMAVLAGGSMLGNSAIDDEVAHIPAAYSYDHFSDYRLNPEHPPLIKDLAGLPLQFMNLKFPTSIPAWTSEVNGQWETGWYFLYHLGNDADAILFWSRLPILLLALGFGVFLYRLMRRRWGVGAALLGLFFYALSPNILAHAGFVTTDLGASVFMFMAVVAFVAFAEKPVRRNFWLLVLALTAAELTKFSALLLYPFLGILALTMGRTYVWGLIKASLASLAGVWLYYFTQVAHMPVDVQNHMISGSFIYPTTRFLGDILVGLNQGPLLHPLIQYLTGVGMVFGRVTGGNVTYFNGQVQSASFKGYFPELFLVKTQVAFLLLCLGLGAYIIWRARNTAAAKWPAHLIASFKNHLLEWALGLFAAFYFASAVVGNLDLGIRHILPVYLPIFVLTAVGIMRMLKHLPGGNWTTGSRLAVAGLLGWYALSTILNYPHFISYFNETIGGPSHSDKYFSDSSVDWGQDLKRFKSYTDAHPEINKVALDYFGGGVPAYYYCPRRHDSLGALVATPDGYDCSKSVYLEWHSQYGAYAGQYIAVSETYLENDRYYADYYNQPGYDYLRERTPIAKIGNSIFLYKLY